MLEWILPFPGNRLDSTIFRYSDRFNPFPVFAGIVFRYSHELHLFAVLARILPFFGTHTDSTLFRYSPGQFVDTPTDSIFFPVLARILPFSVFKQI